MAKIAESLIPNFIYNCIRPSQTHRVTSQNTISDSSSPPCPINQDIDQSPWADSSLPLDILLTILQLLSPSGDFVRFGCVCRLWRSVATKQNYQPPRQIPWLMLSQEDVESDLRSFYSPSEDKTYDEIMLPEASQMKVCGSNHGWLAMLSPIEDMFLLNPMSRVTKPLPPLSKFKKFPGSGHRYPTNEKLLLFLHKIILSKTSHDQFIAVAIYSSHCKLAFARPFDRKWVTIDTPNMGTEELLFTDVISSGNLYYAVDIEGHVVRCEINERHHRRHRPRAEKFAYTPTPGRLEYCKRYLVESSGKLLQVLRYYDPIYGTFGPDYNTSHFVIFEIDMCTREWTQVKCLGDWSIFLGVSASMSLLASDFTGCRSNCIYFTDDKLDDFVLPTEYDGTADDVRAGHDMGIYNLEDGSIEKHYRGHSVSPHSPPIWLTPNPW